MESSFFEEKDEEKVRKRDGEADQPIMKVLKRKKK